MVCKFASECRFYHKEDPTCQKDDGGPFVETSKGLRAYCGHFRYLSEFLTAMVEV